MIFLKKVSLEHHCALWKCLL